MPRRAMTVCTHSGCPVVVPGGRCAEHRAQQDRARGRRQQRGYDSVHERTRAALLAAHVEGTPCRVCGEPMSLSQGLDAAHTVPLRVDPSSKADHLEHSWCNRAKREDVQR